MNVRKLLMPLSEQRKYHLLVLIMANRHEKRNHFSIQLKIAKMKSIDSLWTFININSSG